MIIILPTLFSHGVSAPLQNMVLRAQTHMSRPALGGFVIKAVVIHLTITLRAGAGVRLVCEFLELSGLSAVDGASYGRQYAVTVQVQEAVAKQAQKQRVLLAVGMPPRELAVCEDEAFHPDVCLVTIEPVSNFILVEQYAPDRT